VWRLAARESSAVFCQCGSGYRKVDARPQCTSVAGQTQMKFTDFLEKTEAKLSAGEMPVWS